MSQYFRTLSRLEKGRMAAALDSPLAASARLRGEDGAGEDVQISPFPELELAKRQLAYAALLDNLRAVASMSASPTVVIAGVSGFEAVHPVVNGIASQADQRSIQVLLAELVVANGRRVVRRLGGERPRLAQAGPFASAEAGWFLELTGTPAPPELQGWVRRAGGGADLVLIEAPPLLSSVDGALLAKAGDGLLLVVEPLVTARHALEVAVERSRAAGCELLGLVMAGSREVLPRWLRRLLAARISG